jgi:predicted glycoside hydrolase/deacetylase ChbG (UPF0249 family)
MPLHPNIIANADDFGFSSSVNKAILFCFEQGYINGATLLTNMAGFNEALQMIKSNPVIHNIGVHVNLAEGKPLSQMPPALLDADGNWLLKRINSVSARFTAAEKKALLTEIHAQIDKALAGGVQVTHLDSHYHIHTMPVMSVLFLQVAKHYSLKLRLAQTYREGSYLKFLYRWYINARLKRNKLNYTEKFESVAHFLESGQAYPGNRTAEIMLHPTFDAAGQLTDHYDKATMENWLNYLANQKPN